MLGQITYNGTKLHADRFECNCFGWLVGGVSRCKKETHK